MFMGNLTMADEQFQQQLIGFCAEVTKLREQMREPGSPYRALAEMVRQVGKEHLESTTPDPSGQPPSQASPGGSDES
jgi:nitrate reductase assembly molybdenum cofactor insertion protein NarJ